MSSNNKCEHCSESISQHVHRILGTRVIIFPTQEYLNTDEQEGFDLLKHHLINNPPSIPFCNGFENHGWEHFETVLVYNAHLRLTDINEKDEIIDDCSGLVYLYDFIEELVDTDHLSLWHVNHFLFRTGFLTIDKKPTPDSIKDNLMFWYNCPPSRQTWWDPDPDDDSILLTTKGQYKIRECLEKLVKCNGYNELLNQLNNDEPSF